jgi:DNA recombination protein RmuC
MDTTIYFILGGIICVLVVLWLLRQSSQPPAEDTRLQEVWVGQLNAAKADLALKEQEIRDLTAQLAARDQQVLHLQQTLKTERTQLDQQQARLRADFELLAGQLLSNSTQQLTHRNSEQMQMILQPLREKIREFEASIERKFMEETREKASLRTEIEQLRDLNQQLSQDAHALASALKGQSKVQGDWGEHQLEVLLEKAGLQSGVHFVTQRTFRDDQGSAKRPDFLIQLPGDRQLIIDAKVSLTAFERYFNDPDPARKEQHLRAHVDSLRSHIRDLSAKNYQQLYEVNSPDYLLLFVPLESALLTAQQADPRLFGEALDRNIVLVSTNSLLTTMRTVSHLWRQEKQTRSVQEIARQSGLLYDKFVAFVEDLRAIGTRLDSARTAWDDAMNKLTSAARPGDTLIGKAEKIRELGAKSTKTLPAEYLKEEEE